MVEKRGWRGLVGGWLLAVGGTSRSGRARQGIVRVGKGGRRERVSTGGMGWGRAACARRVGVGVGCGVWWGGGGLGGARGNGKAVGRPRDSLGGRGWVEGRARGTPPRPPKQPLLSFPSLCVWGVWGGAAPRGARAQLRSGWVWAQRTKTFLKGSVPKGECEGSFTDGATGQWEEANARRVQSVWGGECV